MRDAMRIFPILAVCLLSACGDNGHTGVCPDDGDPLGPVCMERVENEGEYEMLSAVAGAFPTPGRHSKYMAPGLPVTQWSTILPG